MTQVTFSARTTPPCSNFFYISWPDEKFKTIEAFIQDHPASSDEELDRCRICYRSKEMFLADYNNEFLRFTDRFNFEPFFQFPFIIDENIRIAQYFIEKASDCLQTARYFAIKSNLLVLSNKTLPWINKYVAHYSTRCTHFSTAVTWLSNSYDQLLQSVYWAFALYTAAKDSKGNIFSNSWDERKIMSLCNYTFVIGELKKRKLDNIHKLLVSCRNKTEEVRKWANYIKHKGGVDYLYLEPAPPVRIFLFPHGTNPNEVSPNKFSLDHFKSPIKIDIDDKIEVVVNAFNSLVTCYSGLIQAIDFEKYMLK